jgi:hypothetical protein
MMVPLQAAYQHVPKLPPVGPEDPGPFAFASKERVDRILRNSGFTNVAIHPHDLSLDLAIGNGLDAAVDAALEMGPASRALEGQPPDAVAAATASIRKAILSSVNNSEVADFFGLIGRGQVFDFAGKPWLCCGFPAFLDSHFGRFVIPFCGVR